MILNATNLQRVNTGFQVIVSLALQKALTRYTEIATVVPSTTSKEEYGWLGEIPGMREWLGERFIQNLTAHGFTIKNRDFESTVGVERNAIEDDQYGVYKPLFEMLADSAATFPDTLVFSLFKSGFTKTCYDGQYFFDTDHQDGDGPVQSNKGTAALSVTSYGAARAQMLSLKKANGEALRINPNLLVHGPQNEGMALKILMADDIDSTTNIYKGTAKPFLVHELGAQWFLLDTTKPVKPFIFQNRKNPQFVALDKPDDANVFMKKKFLYGIDMRCNAGYALWQLAYGSTGAAS
jgi:phage major head subunit gpT-like protein